MNLSVVFLFGSLTDIDIKFKEKLKTKLPL